MDKTTSIEREILNGEEGPYMEFMTVKHIGTKISLNVWKNLLLRNVAGFLNGINKGKIVIGVSNDGEIEGINNELKVLDRTGKSSVDRFTRNISIEINCKLNNAEFYTTINSINIKEKILIVIECIPTPEPIFLRDELYIRKGIGSIKLVGSDILHFNTLRKNKNTKEVFPKTNNSIKISDEYLIKEYFPQKEKIKKEINEIKLEFGELDSYIIKFKEILKEENIKLIRQEISGFYLEYKSEHYTSAALRIEEH